MQDCAFMAASSVLLEFLEFLEAEVHCDIVVTRDPEDR
jgi:hypothetical protein